MKINLKNNNILCQPPNKSDDTHASDKEKGKYGILINKNKSTKLDSCAIPCLSIGEKKVETTLLFLMFSTLVVFVQHRILIQ